MNENKFLKILVAVLIAINLFICLKSMRLELEYNKLNRENEELKILYKYYPDLWHELKKMDKKAYNQFRADYSVEQLEEKFKKEGDT